MFRVTHTSSGRSYYTMDHCGNNNNSFAATLPTGGGGAEVSPATPTCPSPPHQPFAQPSQAVPVLSAVGQRRGMDGQQQQQQPEGGHPPSFPCASLLQCRSDIDMDQQKLTVKQHHNTLIHEKNCKAYEDTIAAPLIHLHFVRAMINEAHRFQSIHRILCPQSKKCLSRLSKFVNKAYDPWLMPSQHFQETVQRDDGGEEKEVDSESANHPPQRHDPYLNVVQVIQKQRLFDATA